MDGLSGSSMLRKNAVTEPGGGDSASLRTGKVLVVGGADVRGSRRDGPGTSACMLRAFECGGRSFADPSVVVCPRV